MVDTTGVNNKEIQSVELVLGFELESNRDLLPTIILVMTMNS